VNDITTPILSQIESLVKDVPGWTPVEQLHTLFNIAFLTSELDGDIVEVGSWCGRSAMVLGLAAKITGKSKVFCVDLFPEKKDWYQNEDGSYSMNVAMGGKLIPAYQEQRVWQEPFERDMAPVYTKCERLLDVFMENMERSELTSVVIPHKGTLESFLAQVGKGARFRLAFIDGDHGYEAARRDIQLVDRVLIPGGWICFDDAFTSYEGVNRAIRELILSNTRFELSQQMTRKLFVARTRRDR
jgi:predicted O-methyltransferase YrrM